MTRNSELIELKKSASRWTRTPRKKSPIACRKTNTLDTKNWWISLNTSGRNEPMKLRSDFNEALTKLHRLLRESGEERLAPIPYWQYQKMHPSSSSSSTSWWQWNDRFLVELMKIHKKSTASELMKEQHIERGDPLCRFFTQTPQTCRLARFFWFVAVLIVYS